jgi:hypothetical protein
VSLEDAIEKGLIGLGSRIVKGIFKNAERQLEQGMKLQQKKLEAMEKQISGAAKKPKKKPRRSKLAVAYEFLGVRPSDTMALAKEVYRAKAKHLHPDKKTGDKAMFQKLENAFKLVSDDLRKRGK